MDPLKISKAAVTLELETFEKDTGSFFSKLARSRYLRPNNIQGSRTKRLATDILDLGLGGTTLDESAIMMGGVVGEFDGDASIQFTKNGGHQVEEVHVGDPVNKMQREYTGHSEFRASMIEDPRTTPGNIIDNESLKARFRNKSANSHKDSRNSVIDPNKSVTSRKSFVGFNSKMNRSYTEIHGDAIRNMNTEPKNDSMEESSMKNKRYMSSKDPEEYSKRATSNESFRRQSYNPQVKVNASKPPHEGLNDETNVFMDSKIMSKIQYMDVNASKFSYANTSATGLAYINYNKPLDELYVSTDAKLLLLDVSDQKTVTLKANVKLKNSSVSLLGRFPIHHDLQ